MSDNLDKAAKELAERLAREKELRQQNQKGGK